MNRLTESQALDLFLNTPLDELCKLANAEKEIGRLENEERRWGRNMNPAQRERLNNLRNFRDQLIGRNDAAKEAERLQKRKDEAVINTEKRLNEIRDWLKVNGGL